MPRQRPAGSGLMMTLPIRPLTPACFGVTCPAHSRCARYAAVNHSEPDRATMLTCRKDGHFPMFVAIAPAKPAAP
jgi:hypothetical protein